MKTKREIEELDTVITNDVVQDVETGEVLFEEITCETSTRLPVLRLADVPKMLNDQMREDQDKPFVFDAA